MTFKHILDSFSTDEAWKHLLWINEHAPSREPGSDGQQIAAEYLVEKLQSYGFEARLDSFTAHRDLPGSGAVEILSSGPQAFTCTPCAQGTSTPEGGLVSDLFYVSGGTAADYDGLDVSGSVVLTDVTIGPPIWEKARIAAGFGANGLIGISGQSPEAAAAPKVSIKSAWGNPTRSSAVDAPAIAAVMVDRTSGETILEAVKRDQAQVRLTVRSGSDWGPLGQPIGRMKVPANVTSDFLLLGSYFDGVPPGMSANAAGNALTLELARVFAKHREALRRDIFVGFWNGHATGAFEGSTWFADRYWDHLDTHAVAYFNVEAVGLAQSSAYVAESTPELAKWHRRIDQQILGGPTRMRYLNRENGQPFFGLGLPALEGRFHFNDEQLGEWQGATRGWWWNTAHDTIDKVDRDLFAQTGHLYARYVWDICSLPVLPMDFTNNATKIDKAVSAMQKRAKDRFELDLPTAHFVLAATQLLAATKTARDESLIHRLNRTMMKLSRILTPAFETIGGRYAQDRRSHEASSSPIPAVHAMQLLANLTPGEELSHRVYTELLRDRNRLSDSLRWATTEIHRALGDEK